MNEAENQDSLDALRRLQDGGDTLTAARDLKFSVVFPQEDVAGTFASRMNELGYSASVDFSEVVKTHHWDVLVVKNMLPSLEKIEEFEDTLELIAAPLGGKNDGWYCIRIVSDESPTEASRGLVQA